MTKEKITASRDKSNLAKLTIAAMLTAVAVVLQYIEVPIPMLVPSFLKFDFSDLPELIGAFVIVPLWCVLICLMKNLIHLPFGSSVGVGEFSNFLLGAVFVFTTKKGALIACLIGSFAMAVISIPSNYFVVYPVYAQLWAGGKMDIIISLYKAILPASDNLIKCLLIFNVPFTLVKGLLVSGITMMIYKPLSNLFVKLNNSLNKPKKKNEPVNANE